MLGRQDKAGIVCCSNGLADSARSAVMMLGNALEQLGSYPFSAGIFMPVPQYLTEQGGSVPGNLWSFTGIPRSRHFLIFREEIWPMKF